MRCLRYVVLLMAMLFGGMAQAQGMDYMFQVVGSITSAYVKEPVSVPYSFAVVDSITRMYVADPEVMAFLPGDSVVATRACTLISVDGMMERKSYMVSLPQDKDAFDVVIDAEGYCTRRMRINVDKTYIPNSQGNSKTINLGEVGLLRLPRQLDEVTVTATKIKLYYQGDTLIYNADAFLLPEGSMLDDLLRKLDGVTINKHGQITCNGRMVSSMMLEGKSLFDGNPRTLMENLGAYTVKKIKVFEQTSDIDKFLGYSDVDTKPLVMDVVLKKQYSVGKWMNLDAGYGTSNRYLGRIFALGFTKTTAFSAFFNGNNLSTGDNPTRGDYWSPGKADGSESSFLSGGLSYQYDSPDKKRGVRGTVGVDSNRKIHRQNENSVTYLTSGDNFQSSFDRDRSKEFKVSTNHEAYLQSSKVRVDLSPSFSYIHNDEIGRSVGAVFNRDFGRLTAADIEAIYSGDADTLFRHVINRDIRHEKSSGRVFDVGLSASAAVVLPAFDRIRHNLTFGADGNYRNSRENRFDRYTINYGADAKPASDVYAYVRASPSWNGDVKGSAKYEMNFNGRQTVSLQYSYKYNRNRDIYDRYLLSNLDNASLESLKFGQIPPLGELEQVIDPVNSRHNLNTTEEHRISAVGSFGFGESDLDKEDAKGYLTVNVRPSVCFTSRRLDYTRVAYDTTAINNAILPQGNISVRYNARKGQHSYSATLYWTSYPILFSMNNLIDVVNDTDPLLVFRGNPNLKNSYFHNCILGFGYGKTKGFVHSHNINFGYEARPNIVISGIVYDPTTGVRTSSLYNMNGARALRASYSGNGTIKHWKGSWAKRLGYSVGFLWRTDRYPIRFTELGGVTSSNFRYTDNLNPSASLTFEFGKAGHTIEAGWKMRYRHYYSNMANYVPSSSVDMQYKLDANFILPHEFRISTDVSLMTNRGYSTLDDNNLVWNIAASWHWKKPNLTFILDGYDLLGQVSNVYSYSNFSGRTEYWTNTLPSYVLLRVRYYIDLTTH